MGLDIFFYKVKDAVANNAKTIEQCHDLYKKRAQERVKKFADDAIKRLKSVKDDAAKYKEVYNSIFFSEMPDYTKYRFTYGAMQGKVHTLADVEKFFDGFVQTYFAEEDAYFRKVNFVYAFFSHKLENESCFVTEEDLKELIDRCNKVLKDHSLAGELLPTRSGFFFGSTDYDEWYYNDVKDCKKQMENLLADYDENKDRICVVMSW